MKNKASETAKRNCQAIKTKKRNCSQKANAQFLIINIILLSLLLVAIIVSVFGFIYNWIGDKQSKEFVNTVGILCQVITATISFVASIMGIAISLQNDECFGVKVKRISRIRKDYHYSIIHILIISIVLIGINIGSYLFNLFILTIASSLIAIAFSVFAIVEEIPFLVKDDKKIIRLIKYCLIEAQKNSGPLSPDLSLILRNLVSHNDYNYNFNRTFQQLSSNDEQYNLFLLMTLFDCQYDAANQLKFIDNKKELNESINNIIVDLRSILAFRAPDISNVINNDLKSYCYKITSSLFRLLDVPEGKEDASNLIAGLIRFIDYEDLDERKLNFIVSILLGMISITVKQGELCVLEHIRAVYSDFYMELSEHRLPTTIFFLISMHIYYLANMANAIPSDTKDKIKSFIYDHGVKDRTPYYSWRHLFSIFSENCAISFKDFYDWFYLNYHYWEYELYNTGHWVELTDEFLIKWFLANKFNSYSGIHYDYNEIPQTNEICRYYFKKISLELYDDGDVIVIPEDFKKYIAFYADKEKSIDWFVEYDKQHRIFFNLCNEIKKQDLDKEVLDAQKIDNVQLASELSSKIKAIIEKELFFDNQLELTVGPLSTGVIVTKSTEIINFQESIVHSFKMSILQELRKSVHYSTIKRDTSFDNQIKKMLKANLTHISKGALNLIPFYLEDADIKQKFIEKTINLTTFDSLILYGDTLIIDDGFKFNCSIDSLSVAPLESRQLESQIERYKRNDGQYVYEGTFLSREQIEKHLKEKLVVVSLTIRYGIISSEEKICLVDLFPKD